MKIAFSVVKHSVWLFIYLFLLSACSPYQRTLTVAAAPSPNLEFLFLANELNYLDPGKFSIFELPSSTDVVQAFQTGKLDIAFLSLDQVLTLVALGIDLKVLAVMDQSVSTDALLVKPKIKTLRGLKWSTIGYENKASGALLLSEIFTVYGLNNQTTELLEVKQNEAKEIYLNDDVDAIIVREPQKQQLLSLGAKELLNSSLLDQPIPHLMIVKDDLWISQKEQITLLLKSVYQAHDYYISNRKAALTTMAVRLQVTPALLAKAFQGTRFIEPREALMSLSGQPSNIELQARKLSKFMGDKNMLSKVPPDFQQLISTTILERVIYE